MLGRTCETVFAEVTWPGGDRAEGARGPLVLQSPPPASYPAQRTAAGQLNHAFYCIVFHAICSCFIV